jgi:hypothetical protein
MASVKRCFKIRPEISDILDRLLPTRSARSESAAFSELVRKLDRSVRQRLDASALALYEDGKLTHAAMLEAFARHRIRNSPQRELATGQGASPRRHVRRPSSQVSVDA